MANAEHLLATAGVFFSSGECRMFQRGTRLEDTKPYTFDISPPCVIAENANSKAFDDACQSIMNGTST